MDCLYSDVEMLLIQALRTLCNPETGEPLDQALILRFPGPSSFTGGRPKSALDKLSILFAILSCKNPEWQTHWMSQTAFFAQPDHLLPFKFGQPVIITI